MKRRVEKFIRENKLCDPGDRILAAVSGGRIPSVFCMCW